MSQNSPDKRIFGGRLSDMQKKVISRVVLVVLTIILSVVLIFSLTVAWQTNVVQTGGLSFSAETWNFSGEVLIDTGDLVIAPGDSGVIPITMKNDSQHLVAASVTVSKEQMNLAQNRIYFYVDSSEQRNGEVVDRVYVSSKKSYTYAMFPFSEIIINENTHNRPRLKWEWVYDNLGYYVVGQATENGGVMVEDYIMPIVYEYDELLTTFDENGDLKTIDGLVSVQDFLLDFSSKDGYTGQIDVASKTAGGFYPVSVSNGYGVWAYLCDYSEIQKGIADDTSWGTSNANLGNVNILISGQNSREDGVLVGSEANILDALSDSGVNVITLNNDIEMTQPIVSNASSVVMIDLDGHTITSSAESIVDVQSGGKVMIYDGSINGVSKTNNAITAIGGELTLSKVEISNVAEGVVVFDNKDANGLDSSVHIIDSDIKADLDGLWIYGNGEKSENLTKIVVENSNISGENYAGILCNGAYYGTDIDIINSTVSGYWAAIYFPQKNSYLTVDNSNLTGHTGVVVKGGTVDINDSVIVGTGAHAALPENPEDLNLSGWVDTGDGVYLESNYVDRESLITITGSKTQISGTQTGAVAVRIYPNGANYAHADIQISGGTYNTDVTEYVKDGYVCESKDGTYVVSENTAG